MTTRLPLRVEPMPGEWWRSYLLRVAATYGVHPFEVMSRVHGIARVERRNLRWSGIAITEEAASSAGAVVNLKAQEIQRMHLSAYDQSALNFTQITPEAFDPGLDAAADRLPLAGVGPLVKVTRDRYCLKCVEQTPGYRAMSWRLQVHLVCTMHRVLLTNDVPIATGATVAADLVDSQCEVLNRLTRSAENEAFFDHLHKQLLSSIGPWQQRLERLAQETPATVLETFHLAVRKATSPGYPDYQGFADWPSALAARHLRAPAALGFSGSLHSFPHLLPMNIFVGGLSDLLHGAQIHQARAIAAVGAVMRATGAELEASVAVLPRRRQASMKVLFLRSLVELEREGRAEQFWMLSGTAARELIRAAVDYRQREEICLDESAYLVARSVEPTAYCRTVRTWLVDQWACTYTSSNVRPSVRDGSIERFDREFGPGMRAALERHLAESAA